MKRVTTPVALGLALIACGGSENAGGPARLSVSSSALTSDNGRSMNGRSMNGRSMSGTNLDGLLLTGLSVSGVTLGGSPVTGVAVTKTVVTGTSNGQVKKAGQLVGSVWPGMLSNGSTVPVRIDGVQPMPDPNADLLGYALSYQTDAGWVPVCGYEPDGSEVIAVPMPGLWNYGQNVSGAGGYEQGAAGMTFACRHFAIGKCVEMGYRPWDKFGKAALLPYAVSCTRMLRADYCGTGVSYTVDGTLIDLYDRLGIQTMTQPEWPIEAEWGPNGARCMAPESVSRFTNSGVTPPCYATLSLTGCGASFTGSNGTFLIDRYLKSLTQNAQ